MNIRHGVNNEIKLEPISKIGFGLKIPPSPNGFAGTRAAGSNLKPQVRPRRIEDLKRGTHKNMGPKDIFETGSKQGA
jgi:hypothetical protein